MLADLHAHFPMHVVSDVTPASALQSMRRVRDQPTLKDKVRALILKIASRLFSDRDWWSGYRVTVPYLREGEVGLVLSALYRPFEEMDLDEPYAAPPRRRYFPELMKDLERVKDSVEAEDPSVARMVTDLAGLDACLASGATAIVHAVEGGFHLGATAQEVEANVATLASRGVAYVTVAHLFFRQVATNAPAIPFLPDPVYNFVFRQGAGIGLTDIGETVVRALVANRVLVDLSHMRPDAVTETLALLDTIDPQRTVPVISSHAGYRFGSQTYMHDEATVSAIAARDGVIGLIMAQHQLNDGIRPRRRPTRTLPESMAVIYRHVDRIHEITGSHRHVAIGSDFDGFIKPTMGGLEDARAMRDLERELRSRYHGDADAIASGNVLRVLRQVWTP